MFITGQQNMSGMFWPFLFCFPSHELDPADLVNASGIEAGRRLVENGTDMGGITKWPSPSPITGSRSLTFGMAFVCAYGRYLKHALARMSDGTVEERERKLHFIASIVQKLYEQGNVSTSNPTKFTDDDVIEIFLALKNRDGKGKPPKRSTLRKQMQLLKDSMPR